MAKGLNRQLGINANTSVSSADNSGNAKPKNLGVSPIYSITGPSIHNDKGGARDQADVTQTGVDKQTTVISG